MAAIGPTKPAAGVIATRPATSPEANPSALGLPSRAHSMHVQVIAPTPAAICEFTSASTASPPAPGALPALNPNQPNQSSPAPSTVMVKLCGTCFSRGKPMRLPITSANTSAETPLETCTTVPPAKSSAPRLASQPPSPHTQCASGSYTSVVHSSVNSA